MNWRKELMPTTQAYNTVMPNQNVYIGAGNSKLDINDNNFYCVIRRCYNRLSTNDNAELITSLPTQANIHMIQKAYLELAETEQDIVIGGVNIKFSSDVWDFTSMYQAGKIINAYKYNFDKNMNLSDYQKTILKLYVFYNTTEYGIHCSSNKQRFNEVVNIMTYMNDIDIVSIEDMTLKDYQEYYEHLNVKYTTMIKKRRRLKEFLLFYSLIASDVFTKELNDWFNDIDTSVVKADIEQNKTPLLPSNFYKKYTSLLYSTAINPEKDKWDRGFCGLLYIGTQTGLRCAELTILRVQDLEIRKHKNKQIGILHYRSTKSGNGKNRVYDDAETNANQKVIELYEVLESLFNKERKALDVDFLVPRNVNTAPNGQDKTIRLHISDSDLDAANKRTCLENAIELKLINSPYANSFASKFEYNNEEIDRVPSKILVKLGVKKGDTISFPTIKQFRVYVASELRERNVDDRTTASLLNHHCVEMYGYYARPKHSIQEDIDFSKEIIKDIVKDKTKILGPKGDAFNEKINQIIKENNFNVEKDLDAIIDKVCDEIPIRAKRGGFCIKSNPRRECRHDAKTDEFMCAYGCCPNHCHMYFMLAVTYKKFKTLITTYTYNLEAGFTNASEKEGYKLIYAIKNELLPELKETKREIQLKGIETVIQTHPEMQEIVNDIDEIEKEALEWMNKLEKTQ